MADTQPKPAAAPPESEVVQVDMTKEIDKLAKRDKAEGRLDKPVTLPLRQMYEREVLQFYAGKDSGYAEGFVRGTKVAASRWPWHVWLTLGAVSTPVAMITVKLVAKASAVFAAVAKVLSE